MNRASKFFILFLLLLISLGCSNNVQVNVDITEITEETTTDATKTPEPKTETPEPTPIPTEAHINLWAAEYLPKEFYSFVDNLPDYSLMDEKDKADILIDSTGDLSNIEIIFALSAPFYTLIDDVDFEIIQAVWSGNPQPVIGCEKLIASNEYADLLIHLLGEPGEGTVEFLDESQLLEYAWENENVWGILLFDQLEPKWKALSVNGQSPIWKEFDGSNYPLHISISVTDMTENLEDEVDFIIEQVPQKFNRKDELLTTVVVTGVTAMARGTAWEMDQYGVLFPAEYIGDLLKAADITHISNEVPFVENCPEPSPFQEGYVFCSDPSYIELLEIVGTDVVELTGDHFGDYTSEDVLTTFEMYDERGWQYYGAGVDKETGLQAITLVHNSNKIAFIGCNAKGDIYTPTNWGQPGSVECDYDWMTEEISRLDMEGYIVIATFQHEEIYAFNPWWKLKNDFRLLGEAGADIVSGSQAHQPHNMEFYNNDSLLLFGLGNLFFDLYQGGDHMDEALITRHVIYDNRYISTELFTIKFISYSQPRFMTVNERFELLEEIFAESGWLDN